MEKLVKSEQVYKDLTSAIRTYNRIGQTSELAYEFCENNKLTDMAIDIPQVIKYDDNSELYIARRHLDYNKTSEGNFSDWWIISTGRAKHKQPAAALYMSESALIAFLYVSPYLDPYAY